MSFSPGVLEVIILALAAVFVFVVVVFRKRSSGGATVIMIGVAASLLMVLGGIFALKLTAVLFMPRSIPPVATPERFFTVPAEIQPAPTTSRAINLRTTLPHRTTEYSPYPGIPDDWAEVDTTRFTADIYPSLSQSLAPLASKVRVLLNAKMLKGSNSGSEAAQAADMPALTVHIPGHLLSEKDRSTVLQRFKVLLQEEFSSDTIWLASDKSAIPETAEQEIAENTVILTLHVEAEEVSSAGWDHSVDQRSGQLYCDILSKHGTAVATAGFIEKPWIAHFDSFVAQYSDRHFVVGYSDSFTSSESEAERQAMLDANRKLRITLPDGSVVHGDLAQIRDRFVQKLSRPYGDVWRAAVLLSISDQQITSMVTATQNRVRQTQVQHRSIVVSLLALFTFTALISVTLNYLTQGYYRRRLLIAGGLVTAALLLVALFFNGSRHAAVPVQMAVPAAEFVP